MGVFCQKMQSIQLVLIKLGAKKIVLDVGGVFAMKQSCVIRVFVKTMVIWDGSVNIMVSAL